VARSSVRLQGGGEKGQRSWKAARTPHLAGKKLRVLLQEGRNRGRQGEEDAGQELPRQRVQSAPKEKLFGKASRQPATVSTKKTRRREREGEKVTLERLTACEKHRAWESGCKDRGKKIPSSKAQDAHRNLIATGSHMNPKREKKRPTGLRIPGLRKIRAAWAE